MNHCPDPEALATYLEGNLSSDERERMEAHLATCDHCYFIVREGARLEMAGAQSADRIRSRSRHAALAALVLAILGLGLWWIARTPDPRHDIVAALEASNLPARTTFGRTSLDAPYAPWLGPERGLDDPRSDAGYWRLVHATSAVHSRIEDPTAEREALRGLAHLILGDGESAIASLERARNGGDLDADLLADLSAAYLQVAAATDDPEAVHQALTWSTRALEIEPAHAPALFNRALALEVRGLSLQAIAAWEEYLQADPDSLWGKEAAGRLRSLRDAEGGDPISGDPGREPPEDSELLASWGRRYPQPSREHLQRVLMPRWGRELLEGQGDRAADTLARASVLARVVAREQGDESFARMVDETRRRVEVDLDAARRDAEAHVAFGEGWRAMGSDHVEAARQLDAAMSLWRALHSEWAPWAEVWGLYLRWHEGESQRDRVLEELDALLVRHDPKGAPMLYARGVWFRGLFATMRLRHDLAIPSLRQAFEHYETAREPDHAMFVAFLIAQSYAIMGDATSAWEWIDRSLEAANGQEESPRYARTLIGIGALATEMGAAEPALAFFDEGLARERNAITRLDAIRHRARLLETLGRHAASRNEIARATSLLAELEPGPLRERLEIEILLDRAEIEIRDDPGQGLTLAREARSRWTSGELLDLQLLLVEAEGAARTGHPEDARATLRRAGDLMEGTSLGERETLDLLKRSTQVYEQALEATWQAERDPLGMLVAAEQARRAGRRPTPDERLVEQRRLALPPSTTLLYFEVLEQRALAWVLASDRLLVFDLPLTRQRLREMVEQADESFRDRGSQRPLTALAEALRGPLRAALESSPAEIVVVPDESLFEVPFPALPVDSQGTPLGARTILSVAFDLGPPNRSDASGNPLPRRPRQTLVFADPRLDPTLFPHLPVLPQARAEAEAIRRLDPGAELLTGTDAGVAAFRRLAPGKRIIHLATHAIANPLRPARSILALASPAGEPPLFASDIAELPLHDTDLVVLSSCGSADTGQGAGGLARAFLQAGASYVIGARGGIRDRQAARLLGDFYRRLYAGDDPAVALHGAQTTFRRAAPGDPTWAAFRLYRGS